LFAVVNRLLLLLLMLLLLYFPSGRNSLLYRFCLR